MTAKKRPSARRSREKVPRWQEVVRTAVGALVEHLGLPQAERRMTVTAYDGAMQKLGELSLPVTESLNWPVDALAKFPAAKTFEITGRNGYSMEHFDVRDGRVYEIPTLHGVRFDDNRPRA